MRQRRWVSLACVCLIFAGVGGFQFYRQAYRTDFAAHPDEAAHFVTGVAVLDYITTARGSNPVSFAESYYARYPKFALGHWPPMFYGIEAVWFAMFGATPLNAMLLIGIVTAITGVVIFLRLNRLYGPLTAILSSSVFLWLPVVRTNLLTLMPDIVAGLFALLAILALSDCCRLGSRWKWMAFALWASAAILTKESALSLLICAPVVLGFFGRRMPVAAGRVWRYATVVLVALAGLAAVYSVTGVWTLRNLSVATNIMRPWPQLQLLGFFFGGGSVLFLLIAFYGVGGALKNWKTLAETDRGLHVGVAFLVLVITLLTQLTVRDMAESRYFFVAFLVSVILFAEGLQRLLDRARKRFPEAGTVTLGLAVAVLCVLTTPAAPVSQRTGYAAIARSIPHDSLGPVILISSDQSGEGALIADRLIDDPAKTGVVLRASKVLEDSDWMGRNVTLLMNSAAEVRAFLQSVPVNYIVLDIFGSFEPSTKSVQRLLDQTIRGDPGRFPLVGDFPLYIGGHRLDGAVQVFENRLAGGRRPEWIQINMQHTLGRVLRTRVEPRPYVTSRRAASWSEHLSSFLDRIPRREIRPASLSSTPDHDEVDWTGGSGRIFIIAPPGLEWSPGNVPDWFEVMGGSGIGDGVITYRVQENRSNRRRSGSITISNARFKVTQTRGSHISLPYFESFSPEQDSDPDASARWVLNNQSGQNASLRLASQGPPGSNSLLLDKRGSDQDAWKTQIYLPGIETEARATYDLSLWVKAQTPGLAFLKLSRSTAPYRTCGLSESVFVPADWTQLNFRFRSEEDCGADSNRLSIEAGWISGKLWLSKIALVKEPA
jgi:hypothetical protein